MNNSSHERIKEALGTKLTELRREPCGCLTHIESPVVGTVMIEGLQVNIVGLGGGLISRSEIDRLYDELFSK